MKPYSNFAFFAGLVCLVALIVVAGTLAVQFPHGGIGENNRVVLLGKFLVVLFLVNSTVLWINGVRVLRERWNAADEFKKLLWLLAMLWLAVIVGYILWYLEHRAETNGGASR